MRHTARAFMMMLASAAAAAAQEDYRHGRVRDVEATVTLQREAEPGAEEAYPNSPFLPGDRIWTDGRGRAEFQFPDGAVLRLDSRGKLDYLTHDEGAIFETIPPGRGYHPPHADDDGIWMAVDPLAGTAGT